MSIFIKFEGGKTKLRGDVKKVVHKDWVTLESAQFSAMRPSVSGYEGSAGREPSSMS